MHCTLELSVPASIFFNSASKIPRNAASVFPLPVGDASRIDLRTRSAGTESSWAWVKFWYAPSNHSARRGWSCFRRLFGLDDELLATPYIHPTAGRRHVAAVFGRTGAVSAGRRPGDTYPSGFTGKCLFFRLSGTRSVCSDSISSVATPRASYASRLFYARHV